MTEILMFESSERVVAWCRKYVYMYDLYVCVCVWRVLWWLGPWRRAVLTYQLKKIFPNKTGACQGGELGSTGEGE